jgi:hypothetical protein
MSIERLADSSPAMTVKAVKDVLTRTIGSLSNFNRKLYDEWVDRHTWECWNRKTTVVVIKLKNGFEIVGNAGCENPDNFSEDLGHQYALEDALRKLGEFAAFYRAQKAFEAATLKPIVTNIKLTPEQIEELRKMWQNDIHQAFYEPRATIEPCVDPGFYQAGYSIVKATNHTHGRNE